MKKIFVGSIRFILWATMLIGLTANAATFTVTNINDSGAGSLRQALLDANAAVGLDTITFNIPGAGVNTIALASALPNITSPVVIDGYTQPGSSANTNAFPAAINAVSLIEINFSTFTGFFFFTGSDGSTVRGLILNGANADIILSWVSNVTIVGNFLGTNASGTVAVPGGLSGFGMRFDQTAANATIGGPAAADRNLISGKGQGSVILPFPSTSGHLIQGNYIGTDVTGTIALNTASSSTTGLANIGGAIVLDNLISGNLGGGVLLFSNNTFQGNLVGTQRNGTSALPNGNFGGLRINGNGSTVGGSLPGQANTIAFNVQNGIGVVNNNFGNRIAQNSIYSNTALGITLVGGGTVPLANDVGDLDVVPGNRGQNYPVIVSAAIAAGTATISGTINSNASTALTLEFFANAACDASGNGEGQTFIGNTAVTTDVSGNASFGPLVFPVPAGQAVITSTSTDSLLGNTSEFSQCLVATVPGAPTITAATPGNTQATIAFTAPASNGGSPITGYTVTCNPGAFSGSGAASPLTVTGLTNGVTYSCTVTAANAIGTGPPSAPINVTPVAAPVGSFTVTPASIAFGNINVGALSATSTVTVFNNSTFVAMANIVVSASGAFVLSNTCPAAPATLASGGSCTIGVRFAPITPGLQTGTLTISTSSSGTQSVGLSGTGIDVPGAPTINTATPGNAQATISFTAPASDGGSAITSYTVTCGTFTGTGAASPITITGLANGTTYPCSVTATNAIGTGPASATLNVTPAAPVGSFTVAPASIAFGNINVGALSATSNVTVTNSSTSVAMANIVVSASGAFMLSNTCPAAPATLASGGTCTIGVRFAPITPGLQTGTLSISTSSSGSQLVSLNGTGVPLAVANPGLSPTALDFGTQPVGTTSIAQTLILANSGNAALAVSSVTTSGAFAVQPTTAPAATLAPCATAPFSLPPGASCFIDVVFAPTAGGGASGSVVIASSNASPVSATLTGVGGEGKLIQISPTTLAFPDQVLNVLSAPLAFTVTNVGTLAVNITSLLVSSGATDFRVTHNCGVVNTLASGLGNTCSGAVTFQPSVIGARSGIVSVVSDAQGSPHTLALTGNALVQPFALLTTSVSSLGFGERGIANRSATQTFRVTNSGNVPVDISAIYTTGDFYQSHNCPNTLNSAQSCEVGAWFLPSIPGARAGEVVLTSSGQGGLNRVVFQGTGCRFFTLPGSRLAQLDCKP